MIPFCNVYFAGSQIGGITDFNGDYFIETLKASDSLSVSFLGFHKKVALVKKGVYQVINFELEPNEFTLPEIQIKPGKNPALILLDSVIANREKNSLRDLECYQYEIYTKMEIDANNISERFKNRKIVKPFQFYFDFIDTSTINGKKYLPIFISESISDYYYRNNPTTEREVIKAARISGIENESVLMFLGNTFQKYSIYDNYINLFQRNFISPISKFSPLFYKYHLVDSAYQDDKWCYRVMFKERRTQENTFTGFFWVHDTTYAVKSYEIKISEKANINYINDLVISQEFDLVQGRWMVTKEKALVDLNILEDRKDVMGFFGKKTSTYKNFVFNQPVPEIYQTPVRVVLEEDAQKNEDEFWEENRHIALTDKEQQIYNNIDTLKSLPIFKTWVEVVETLVNGYYELPGKLNKYEIGPFATLVSRNDLEGYRLRIGGRTTENLTKKFRFEGHVAYGTKDENWKYNVSGFYQPSQSLHRKLELGYKYDVEQLSSGPNALDDDLFFAAFLRRTPANKMSMAREYRGSYLHEWFNGFSNTAAFYHRIMIPVEEQIFVNGSSGPEELNKVTVSEFRLDTRLAYDEKFVLGDFSRIRIGTNYPVLTLEYAYGMPDLFQSNYEYHKLRAGLRGFYNVGVIGRSRYRVELGRTWGTLPYPLLNLQPGNETFIYGDYSYSLMNYFEFITDNYANLFYIHHFHGFFLNRIPLIKKLKWREVAHVKTAIGTLSGANANYNILPEIAHPLNTPYVEAGVGVENVFKILRFDAVWRLTHRGYANTNNFALMFSMNFAF